MAVIQTLFLLITAVHTHFFSSLLYDSGLFHILQWLRNSPFSLALIKLLVIVMTDEMPSVEKYCTWPLKRHIAYRNTFLIRFLTASLKVLHSTQIKCHFFMCESQSYSSDIINCKLVKSPSSKGQSLLPWCLYFPARWLLYTLQCTFPFFFYVRSMLHFLWEMILSLEFLPIGILLYVVFSPAKRRDNFFASVSHFLIFGAYQKHHFILINFNLME